MSHTTDCPNCLTPLKGEYCYACGQSTRGVDRFFLTLVNEAFEDIFSMSSRVWKTLGYLLFKPGFLSQEYFIGRRVRYIPPVRLYFTLSILFFLTYSVFSFFTPENPVVVVTADEQSDARETQNTVANEVRQAIQEAKKEAPQEASEQNPVIVEVNEETEFDLPWLNEAQEEAFRERMAVQLEKGKAVIEDDPGALKDFLLDAAPPIVFCLLPLFALLLKILYLFKGMYYTQHLILAVHNHCFVFLWFTLYTLIDAGVLLAGLAETPGWLDFVLIAWFTLYLWRSLRVVYEQGRLLTFFKFITLGFGYSVLATIAVLGAFLFGLMTI